MATGRVLLCSLLLLLLQLGLCRVPATPGAPVVDGALQLGKDP